MKGVTKYVLGIEGLYKNFEFVDLVRLSVSISRGNFGCLTISFQIYLEHFIEQYALNAYF